MKKLKDTIASVYREIPTDAFTQNVFGGKSLSVFQCKVCKCVKLTREAYLKSKRDRKDENDIRSTCVECYIKRNGRVFEKDTEGKAKLFADSDTPDENKDKRRRRSSKKVKAKEHSSSLVDWVT